LICDAVSQIFFVCYPSRHLTCFYEESENLFLLEIVNKKNNGKLNSILQTELKNVLISAVEK